MKKYEVEMEVIYIFGVEAENERDAEMRAQCALADKVRPLQWHIASIVAEEMEPDTYPAGPAVKCESDTMVKNIPLPMSEQEEIERLKEDLETMENEYERLSVDSDMVWRRMRDELDKCRAALEAANKRIEELKRP